MNLQVQVKDTRGVLLASGPATCGRAFPEIEIDLTHKGPPGLLVYTLHLVARPQKGDFLRGDCNGDGQVTGSVTDAVLLLSYNFTGGREPPCLAACDANGDGQVLGQVADAIYLLEFGFLGGSPPSAPYPACGPGTEPDHALGCKAPPSACGGG